MSDTSLLENERLSKMLMAGFKRHYSYMYRRSAYTLVELLTVVAIIIVIAAILLPVFIKIKETARISMCVSNMRQIGSAMGWYLEDYDDRFPSAAPWGAPAYWNALNQTTIQQILYPYLNNGMVIENGFYKSGSVFECPSDNGVPSKMTTNSQIYGVPVGESTWKYTGCSYEYYASNQSDLIRCQTNPPQKPWTALSPQVIVGNHLERIGAPASAIVELSTKAVMGDTYFWHFGDCQPDGRVAYLNTLFADGHAARINTISHVESRLQQLKHWHCFKEVNR